MGYAEIAPTARAEATAIRDNPAALEARITVLEAQVAALIKVVGGVAPDRMAVAGLG